MSETRFTLKQCRYFLEVARLGGIAQAARSLNISQPAVAQAIDKLEQMTELVLFERFHAKGLELTLQGRAFRDLAEKLTGTAEEMSRNIAHIAAGGRGTIRVGCFQSIAPFHMARLVRYYKERQPGVSLDIFEKLQADLVSDLKTGDLDIAILYDLGLNPAELDWQILAEPKPYILLNADHPYAGRKTVSLHELAQEPYILFDAPDSREYFHSFFADLKISPDIALRSTSFESVRSAVGHNLGFSLLTMRRTDGLTYDGGAITEVEIEEDIAPTKVVLAWKKDMEPGSLVRDFTAFCREDLSGRL